MQWASLVTLFFIRGPAFRPRKMFRTSQWRSLRCPFCDSHVDPPEISKRRVVYISECVCGAQFFVDTAKRSIQMMWSLERTPRGFRVVHNYCPEKKKVAEGFPPYYDILNDLCHVTFIRSTIGGVCG